MFRRLIGRAGHGKCDWYSNLRNRARFKSPASERAHGRVIQDRVSYTLGHASVSDTSAACINRNHADAASGNVSTACFVGIIWPWGTDRDRFCLKHAVRSEEHTSELQSRVDLVCRLLLEKKKKK